MSIFKKIIAACMGVTMLVTLFTGCSDPNPSSQVSSFAVSSAASGAASAENSSQSSEASSMPPEDAQKVLLQSMQEAARSGKVINCDFAVKSNVIDDVRDKWGKEDKSEYIASAKGTYATYSKHDAVFGFNKGSQLFEVRSFDSRLKDISLAKVQEVLGKPDHDVKSANEEIIGYVINKEFKILLAFPNPKTSGEEPKLDHYSVFYPDGTINTMADDPGRQW